MDIAHRVERVKNKDGKEMASMKSPKNTKQSKRRRHVGSLKNNYIPYPEIFRSMAASLFKLTLNWRNISLEETAK